MPEIRFLTSSTPSTASSTAPWPVLPLSSAACARSAWEAAFSAICEAVRASSSMAAVISTTDAACSEEPEASSEAISLTELAAEATSIELDWICCASTSSALVALRQRQRELPRQRPRRLRAVHQVAGAQAVERRDQRRLDLRPPPLRRPPPAARRFCCER